MEQTEVLIRLRKEKGLSQAEVAEELGVTRQAVSRWEAGRAWPSAENLVALSRVYGMTVEEMMHGHKEGTEAEEPSAEEGGQEETESNQAAEQTRGRFYKRRWGLGLAAIFLAGYLCVVIGILLWGRLTNAPSMASNYLICVTLISILVWLVYFFYSLFQFIRRLVKK